METFIAVVPSPVGAWAVEGTADAVTAVYLPTQPHNASNGTPPPAVADAVQQLEEYFGGTRKEFNVHLATERATEFQRDVWNALVEIPFGEVRTYGQVAHCVERPGGG
jgi:methylated-DNA-[protein]-cysteine S-methyltransferase